MSARSHTFRERLYGADAVREGRAPDVPPLVPSADDGAPAPLSFAQQRIWFYDQLYPGDPLYHGADAFRLRGPLDARALRGALDALVARQPSLRTRFPAAGGVPAQVTERGVPFALRETSALDEAAALAAVVDEVRRPFDLARDRSLTRGILVSLGPDDRVLSIALHHAVWDGTSMGLVYEELRDLYAARAHGDPAREPAPLPVEYTDYARWQRAVFTPAALARQRAYWRERLAGVPALALPADRARPPERRHHGARVWRPRLLGARDAARLRALARAHGATLFTALLAGYAAALARASGQTEFPLGFPVAGRVDPALARVVGCFINMLVLRADLRGEPSFAGVLTRVRDAVADALDCQDVPFESVVADLRRPRDLSRAPLFDVMLNFRSLRTPTLELDGVAVEPLRLDFGIANYDQTFELTETNDGLDAKMQFDTDLYDAPTLERLVESVGAILRAALDAPDRPLALTAH
jgi:hypothetical protein